MKEISFNEESFITRFRDFAKEHGHDFNRVPDDVFSQVFRTKKWKKGILKAFQKCLFSSDKNFVWNSRAH